MDKCVESSSRRRQISSDSIMMTTTTKCPSCALSKGEQEKPERSLRWRGNSSSVFLLVICLSLHLISSSVANATAATETNYSNAEFINGFANSIRRIHGVQLVGLSRIDPFQLQFRTACPSSNLIYNENFVIYVNAEGKLGYRNKETNATKELHRVNDGQWHSLVFNGSSITFQNNPSDQQQQQDVHDNDLLPVSITYDSHHGSTNGNSNINNNNGDNELSHEDILNFFDGFVGCVRIASSEHHHHNHGPTAAHLQAPHATSGGSGGGEDIDTYDEFGHGHFDDLMINGSEGNITNIFQFFHAFPACNDLTQDLSTIHPCHGETFVFCQKCKGQCGEVMSENGKQNTCNCSNVANGQGGVYCDSMPKTEMAEPGRIAVRPSIEPDSEPANTSAASSSSASTRGHPRSGNVNGFTENVMVEGSTMVTTQMTPIAPPPASIAAPPPCPCQNGGVCSNTTDGLPCLCSLDYEGQFCETNPHECSDTKPCRHGICHPQEKKCYCTPGYTGNYCESDIDECISNPCRANSTVECRNLINRYSCVCVPGFTSKHCEINIDECASNPCQNGATCVDQINSYSCQCVPGFAGMNCEINIDECADDGTGPKCYNNGTCIDKINGFDCNCAGTGFEGARCENNIDDCLPANCQHGGICIDKVLGYECQCHRGYDGYTCATDINECDHEQMLQEVGPDTARSPCVEGDCYELSNESLYQPKYWGIRDMPDVFNRSFAYENASGYFCYCPAGFAGTNCEIDLNECELPGGGSPCVRGKCIDGRNNYTCECPPGYEGRNCSEEINECLSNPCYQGTCEDKVNDFMCHCPDGYGAKDCSVLLRGCSPTPCLNNGTCKPFYENEEHFFACTCPPGFSGHICETVTTMSFDGVSYVTVSSNDENYNIGKYEMQFRFRTTLSNVLVAVGQGLTYFMLTLSDGKLNLQSSLLNSLNGISSGTNLSNAEWHKVWISVNETHIALAANLEQTIHPISENQESSIDTGFNMTVLGGATPTLNFLNKDNLGFFVGCVQDVVINGVPVHAEVKNSNITINNGVLKGCPRKEQCKPTNPCGNGGRCTDLWQKYQCSCPRPYLGRRCEYQYEPATFGSENATSSIAEVKIPAEVSRKFSNSFDISMFVRTRKSSGTIFFLGEDSRENGLFLEAQVMDDGQLAVVSKLDEVKEDSYTVDGHQINDGIPHLINVQKEKGLVKISINGSEHFRKSVKDKVGFNPTVMFIGGVIPSDVPPEVVENEDSTVIPGVDTVTRAGSSVMARMKPFKGIIQDVRVNLSATDIPPNASTHDHFVVEFFPLNIPVNYSMGQPLGNVTLHGDVLKGIVSDFTCASNPCLNGGTCEVTWNDFKCHCKEGVYDGKICDVMLRCAMVKCPTGSTCHNIGADGFECVADAAFDGRSTSSPHYELKSNDIEQVKIPTVSFRYRSKTGGSILYLASRNASMRVAIEYESSLRAGTENRSNFISVYLNSERSYIRVDNALDGNWHDVELSVSSINSLMLAFDAHSKQRIASDVSPHVFQEIVLGADPQIIVGSHIRDGSQYEIHANDAGRSSNSFFNHPESLHDAFFRGCLKEVKLGIYQLPFVAPEQLHAINTENSTIIDTTAPTAFYMETGSTPPKLGCVLCYDNECLNGGSCADPSESFDCSCQAGFEGQLCETDIDECVDNKCAHGSKCVDQIANYTCECPKGYTSWLCSEDINECEELPCKNDAECINMEPEDGFYFCNCTEDYHGAHCEKRKLSTCENGNEPCENGAICKPVPPRPDGLSFVCECPQGYEGFLCDSLIDHCKDVICANGGTCHNALVGYQCACMPGWVGPRCETNRDECSIDIRNGEPACANGGVCIDGINEFSCDCKGTGYTGENCEIDVDECESPERRRQCGTDFGKVCVNLPGKYECRCPEHLCGTECNIDNPCDKLSANDSCIHGECIPMCEEDPNMWRCECEEGFTGQYCASVLSISREQSLDIAIIVIPILTAFLLAIVIAAFVLVKMARKKRATRGVYSPSQQEYCNPRVELDNVLKPPPEERLI